MPGISKKNINNLSFNALLIEAKNTTKVVNLETLLTKIINKLGKAYNNVLKNSQGNHSPAFTRYQHYAKRIGKLIASQQKKGRTSPLIKTYYLEACLCYLQSSLNALSLEPSSEEQLNKNNATIADIKAKFEKLQEKFNTLQSNNANSKNDFLKRAEKQLADYLKKSPSSWEINQQQATYYWNYALTLEGSNLQNNISYLKKSAQFYKTAAKDCDQPNLKRQLTDFATQTRLYIAESKKRSHKNLPSLKVTLTRCNDKWRTVKPDIGFKSFGITECEQLLNEFTRMAIDQNLASSNAKSFDERRAIAYNNYAMTLLTNLKEALSNPMHSIAVTEIRDTLNKTKQQFLQSAHYYAKASLLKNKGKAIQCINLLEPSIEKLASESIALPDETRALCTQKSLPSYLTRGFFKEISTLENNQQRTSRPRPN